MLNVIHQKKKKKRSATIVPKHAAHTEPPRLNPFYYYNLLCEITF